MPKLTNKSGPAFIVVPIWIKGIFHAITIWQPYSAFVIQPHLPRRTHTEAEEDEEEVIDGF